MATARLPVARRGFGATSRRDNRWLEPLATAPELGTFVVYSTWAAFQAAGYRFAGGGADYLSPFYSPVLFDAEGNVCGHAWFGTTPSWWPRSLPYSPAFPILWAPAGFRFNLLLLPRRPLQGLLGRPASLRGRRAAQGPPRREFGT
jgi:hypothetical protein